MSTKKVTPKKAATKASPKSATKASPKAATKASPKATTPKATTPKATTPKATTPKADTPKADTPQVAAPVAATPSPAVESPTKKRKQPDTPTEEKPDTNGASVQPPKKKGKITDPNGDEGTILIKSLPWTVKPEDIQNFLESAGVTIDPESIHIPKKNNGKDYIRGFAFVNINTGLQKALALSGKQLGDRTLVIECKTGVGAAPPAVLPKTVFVYNLNFETTAENIKKAMEAFGTVTEVRLGTKPQGGARGWAHVDYETEEEAKAAIGKTETFELDGRKVRVNPANAKNGGGRGGYGFNKGLGKGKGFEAGAKEGKTRRRRMFQSTKPAEEKKDD